MKKWKKFEFYCCFRFFATLAARLLVVSLYCINTTVRARKMWPDWIVLWPRAKLFWPLFPKWLKLKGLPLAMGTPHLANPLILGHFGENGHNTIQSGHIFVVRTVYNIVYCYEKSGTLRPLSVYFKKWFQKLRVDNIGGRHWAGAVQCQPSGNLLGKFLKF